MDKIVAWFVYDASSVKRKFLGEVKASNGKKAMRLARRQWRDLPLDVIRARYVVDRDLCTMGDPKKKRQT